MSRFAAILALGVSALTGPSQAEDLTLDEAMRSGLDSIVARLSYDPLVIEQCTRLGADAVRTYTSLRAEGRGAEAMTAISQELEPKLVDAGLYVCGIYALSNAFRVNDSGSAGDSILPVAVAMNWASANAVPFGKDITGSVFYASAAASSLYGMPPESTEPVFCIAARNDLAEAKTVLAAWPKPLKCDVVFDAPETEAEPEDVPVILASVQTDRALTSTSTAEEATVEAPPVIEAAPAEPEAAEPVVEETTDTDVAAEDDTTQTETEVIEPEPEPEPLISTEELNMASLSGDLDSTLSSLPVDGAPVDGSVEDGDQDLSDIETSDVSEPAEEPDVYLVDGEFPEGAPPPAVGEAYATPPAQRLPEAVEAPRAGLSECRAFFKNYWTEEGAIVSVKDTFCKDEDGDYLLVDTGFTVIE